MLEFLFYLMIINIVSFCLFAWDKQRSRKGAWRIRERDLLLLAILGGSLGSLLGMYTLQHKTRHIKFKVGIPLIVLLQAVLLFYVTKQ